MKRFIEILTFAGPGLLRAAGVPADVIPHIMAALIAAEESQQDGVAKKQQVLASVQTRDPRLHQALDKAIDATIETLNVFKRHPVAPMPGTLDE